MPTKKKAAKKAVKAAKPKAKRKPNAALMKAMTPSPALAAVVGNKAMPRTEVTKKIWDYIKNSGKFPEAENLTLEWIGTVPGTLLGALFLRVVIDGVAKVIKTGADVYEGLIVGIVVVVAVAFSQMRQALRTGREAFPGGLGSVTVVNLGVLTTVIVSQLAGTTWALALGMGVTVFLAGIKVWQSLRKA